MAIDDNNNSEEFYINNNDGNDNEKDINNIQKESYDALDTIETDIIDSEINKNIIKNNTSNLTNMKKNNSINNEFKDISSINSDNNINTEIFNNTKDIDLNGIDLNNIGTISNNETNWTNLTNRKENKKVTIKRTQRTKRNKKLTKNDIKSIQEIIENYRSNLVENTLHYIDVLENNISKIKNTGEFDVYISRLKMHLENFKEKFEDALISEVDSAFENEQEKLEYYKELNKLIEENNRKMQNKDILLYEDMRKETFENVTKNLLNVCKEYIIKFKKVFLLDKITSYNIHKNKDYLMNLYRNITRFYAFIQNKVVPLKSLIRECNPNFNTLIKMQEISTM